MPDAQQFWIGDPPLLPWGIYTGSLRRAIATLKYENQPQLARPLGQWLGQRWLAFPDRPARAVVVPIPMHAEKERQRGFNQAILLAQAFCQVTGLPLMPDGLCRVRSTTAQFGLSAAEREQNVAGAFRVNPRLVQRYAQWPVLLLDDIYTTGATARAAVQVLQQHRLSVVGVVTIARPLKDPQRADDLAD